jgi:hypothetical protein
LSANRKGQGKRWNVKHTRGSATPTPEEMARAMSKEARTKAEQSSVAVLRGLLDDEVLNDTWSRHPERRRKAAVALRCLEALLAARG